MSTNIASPRADATQTPRFKADPGLSIGHVHLKVSDLDRSVAFYRDVLGLEVMEHLGDRAAFLSAGGYHHHLGLNTWHSKGGPRPAQNAVGLFHTAFLYPSRGALARALQNVLDHDVTLEGAADHGVSEAIYFSDPDGNGIEIYRDRPRAEWPLRSDGSLSLESDRLDLDALLAEAP
ncbi:VOC family protein [Gymnodinialimonas sp.]